MKKRIAIFGLGFYGKNAYQCLKDSYEIVCFFDNNSDGIGSEYEGIAVLSGDCIDKEKYADTDIIICTKAYMEIAGQLYDKGLFEFYVLLEGFLYHCSETEMMIPVELNDEKPHPHTSYTKSILFMQNAACVRTHRIASLMRDEGYSVSLLYTLAPPVNGYKEYKNVYEAIHHFTSADGILDFINESDFDVIHCSNEPDILINIALWSNKPVINDVHDMKSIRGDIGITELAMEYMANRYSSGNIYVSEPISDLAYEKYAVDDKRRFHFGNYVYEQVDVETPTAKLSDEDGMFHCVYEGGIVGELKSNHRYFDELWKTVADVGIHIHFYSPSDVFLCERLEKISPYIHFEGNVGGVALINELAKYDAGLALFNTNARNSFHLEYASINKVYEYLNAGIPVLSYGVNSLREFLEKYSVGREIDLDGDIKDQIRELVRIKVPCDFLKKNNFTMKSNVADLVKYYASVEGGANEY